MIELCLDLKTYFGECHLLRRFIFVTASDPSHFRYVGSVFVYIVYACILLNRDDSTRSEKKHSNTFIILYNMYVLCI